LFEGEFAHNDNDHHYGSGAGSYFVAAGNANVLTSNNVSGQIQWANPYDRYRLSIIGSFHPKTHELVSITLLTDAPIMTNHSEDNIYYINNLVNGMTFHKKGGITLYITERKSEKPDPAIMVPGNQYEFKRFTSKSVRRVRCAADLAIARRALGIFKGVLGIAIREDRLPNEIGYIHMKHPELKDGFELCMFACPYSQMVLDRDCAEPAILLHPSMYSNPRIRKATRDKDFKKFMAEWVGNTTKPVMRAAGASTAFTEVRETNNQVVGYVQDGIHAMMIPKGKFCYPIVYDGDMLRILMKEFDVPLEKAAIINATLSTVDDRAIQGSRSFYTNRYYGQDMTYGGPGTEKDQSFKPLRDFFKLVGKEQAINYLMNTTVDKLMKEENLSWSCDALRMLNEFKDPSKFKSKKSKAMFPEGLKAKRSWKTIKELHDDISRNYTKLKAIESRKRITWPEELKGLHGARKDDIRILLPRTTVKITEWGKDQNHCVASYADRMVEGTEIIFGVYKGPKLTYVGRIHRESWANGPLAITTQTPAQVHDLVEHKKVILRFGELRSHSNKAVPKEDVDKVYSIMMQFKVEDLYEGRWTQDMFGGGGLVYNGNAGNLNINIAQGQAGGGAGAIAGALQAGGALPQVAQGQLVPAAPVAVVEQNDDRVVVNVGEENVQVLVTEPHFAGRINE
jgi:hypothetical protein